MLLYVQPSCAYIITEITDKILIRVKKVLLKKNITDKRVRTNWLKKGFKILDLSLLSYVKKMLNKLYNLFAKKGHVIKLRIKGFFKENIKIIPAQIKD